jgi:phosphoserine phosphatase RsbU/P
MKLKIASAGHDPLFHLAKDTTDFKLILPKGCALGVCRENFRKKIGEEEISLRSGDLLALTTDGVNEATNAKEEFFGDKRLFDFLVKNAPHNVNFILNGLVAEIERFYHGDPQSDDITMVMIKVK